MTFSYFLPTVKAEIDRFYHDMDSTVGSRRHFRSVLAHFWACKIFTASPAKADDLCGDCGRKRVRGSTTLLLRSFSSSLEAAYSQKLATSILLYTSNGDWNENILINQNQEIFMVYEIISKILFGEKISKKAETRLDFF